MFRYILLLLSYIGLCGLKIWAQPCSDSSTALRDYDYTLRTNTNNLQSYASGFALGDYWYYWAPSLSVTTYKDGVQTHSGSASATGGYTASIYWNDTPSLLGAGTYSLNATHYWTAWCSTSGPIFVSLGNNVQKPTITQSNASDAYPQALWNLGPGTALAIPSGGSYYRQQITLTIDRHCLVVDSCNDAATWTITSPASTLALSTITGNSVYLNKGSSMGNCQYDTPVQVNASGWYSSAVVFGVNSPSRAIQRGDIMSGEARKHTVDLTPGYQTTVPVSFLDVCAGGGNLIYAMPWYETFGTWQNPGVISGWSALPPPTSSAVFNWPSDPRILLDYIAAHDTTYTWNPAPVFTFSAPPYTYNTVISQAPHSYFLGAGGNSVYSGGVNVFANGWIFYFRDHGDTY